ncbi:MAG: hypothetical protein Q7S74_01080 [Nanoarchaeota archaeon]|nr:hypothetical protein [Nanoarchaeota archaeon]
MEKELISLINERGLSMFDKSKNGVRNSDLMIFKTPDGKSVHSRVLSKISQGFVFSDTEKLWGLFSFTENLEDIQKRQEFFKNIERGIENNVLNELKIPKQSWKPKYGIVAVTENDKTFNQLKNLGCPVKFLISEYDVQSLENYEVVQVVDCGDFSRALEQLPQAVFLDSIDDVYLERYLEILSGWKENLELLDKNKLNDKISEIVSQLYPLLNIIKKEEDKIISRKDIESAVEKINIEIFNQIKQMTIGGESLFAMLSKQQMPKELEELIKKEIANSGLPSQIFLFSLPIGIDEEELGLLIKKQSNSEHGSFAEKVKRHSKQLREIPVKIKELTAELILYDFKAGVSEYIKETNSFPSCSEEFLISNSKNILLDSAKPISFQLDKDNICSILTGANSGGKTTLLEHIIQLISLFQLGLPISGEVKMPLFLEVYYFAKNKGTMNKGAFENLLTQMSKIKVGKQTLILADEIEAVTEPGVAGMIVCASAQYFIEKNCFVVIATHLGQEIQKKLPKNARIDGIEAKGLDENYELIVDHNPVLGRLANSTPELIVEKMAGYYKEEYFNYISEYLKNSKI